MKEGEVISRPLANLYYKWTTPDAMITCTTSPNGKESFNWAGGQLVPVSFCYLEDWGLHPRSDIGIIGPYLLRRVATHYYNETVIFTLDTPNAFWYVWRVKLIEALLKLVVRIRRMQDSITRLAWKFTYLTLCYVLALTAQMVFWSWGLHGGTTYRLRDGLQLEEIGRRSNKIPAPCIKLLDLAIAPLEYMTVRLGELKSQMKFEMIERGMIKVEITYQGRGARTTLL